LKKEANILTHGMSIKGTQNLNIQDIVNNQEEILTPTATPNSVENRK